MSGGIHRPGNAVPGKNMSHSVFGKYRHVGEYALQKAAKRCQREQMDCIVLCRLEDALLSPGVKQLLWNMSQSTLYGDVVVTVQEAAEPFLALSAAKSEHPAGVLRRESVKVLDSHVPPSAQESVRWTVAMREQLGDIDHMEV